MWNIYYEGRPMQKLMLLMGFGKKDFKDNRAPILDLPAKKTGLFMRIPGFDCHAQEIMPELRVVEKLCELRYEEKNAGLPICVISEFVL